MIALFILWYNSTFVLEALVESVFSVLFKTHLVLFEYR